MIPNIEDMIYEIRGKQVMLDSDLAKLYNIETFNLNKAVKRNIERFPNDFMFRLTNNEYKNLIFQNGITNKHGGRRTMPYVFTEEGVAMLSSILHTVTASKMSVRIMSAFVKMRHYIKDNLLDQQNINAIVLDDHSHILKLDNDVRLIQETFDKLEEKRKVNEIYFNGQIYDAYSKIKEIFFESKKELIIIDNYADKKILDMIKNINTKVIIITKEKSRLSKLDIEEYNKQYSNLKVIYDNTFHDRYFIIDRSIFYHSGTSINYIGLKTFSINILEDEIVKESLLSRLKDLVI